MLQMAVRCSVKRQPSATELKLGARQYAPDECQDSACFRTDQPSWETVAFTMRDSCEVPHAALHLLSKFERALHVIGNLMQSMYKFTLPSPKFPTHAKI